MDRYRVRVKRKSWSDNGPDLLRTVASAVEAAVDALPDRGPWSWRKQRPSGEFFPWREVGAPKAVSPFLDEILPTLSGGQLGQLGDGVGIATAEIRGEAVHVQGLMNATGSAEKVHALVSHQFPDARFSGCYCCKQFNHGCDDPVVPDVGWSDHSWGDAVDESENKPAGVFNDDVFDWALRMAQAGLLPVEQVIGSRKRREVTASAPDWKVGPFDSTPLEGSHLVHVHFSCRQHGGTKPPCAP